MADGRWTMTRLEMDNVACGFDPRDTSALPNFKQHRYIDNRDGKAEAVCAFCGHSRLEAGFGGYGEGFGYKSYFCPECGGSTDLVYKDEVGRFSYEGDSACR